MTNEPNKRFPRVSSCCKKSIRVCSGDDFSTPDDMVTCWNECTECGNPCDSIADEGLEKHKVESLGYLDPKEPLQPSAPSMSIEKAKKIIGNWEEKYEYAHKLVGKDKSMFPTFLIKELIEAASLLAASEQRKEDAEIVQTMLDEENNRSASNRSAIRVYYLEEIHKKLTPETHE